MTGHRMAGAVAHFVREALLAARDADDALMRDVESVTPVGASGLEVVVAGQRVEIVCRPAEPGLHFAGGYADGRRS